MKKHVVIYKGAGVTVTQEMNQQQLVKLLSDGEIELISVNAPKIPYRRKRHK